MASGQLRADADILGATHAQAFTLTMHIGPTPSGPHLSGNPAQNAGLYGWRIGSQGLP
jgi:hypothetical protein